MATMLEDRAIVDTAHLETAILRQVNQRPCTIEELVHSLPIFTWNQVFATVDRLSRTGTVVLRRPTSFVYEVSMAATQPEQQQTVHA